jgi:hypothetical protein
MIEPSKARRGPEGVGTGRPRLGLSDPADSHAAGDYGGDLVLVRQVRPRRIGDARPRRRSAQHRIEHVLYLWLGRRSGGRFAFREGGSWETRTSNRV